MPFLSSSISFFTTKDDNAIVVDDLGELRLYLLKFVVNAQMSDLDVSPLREPWRFERNAKDRRRYPSKCPTSTIVSPLRDLHGSSEE